MAYKIAVVGATGNVGRDTSPESAEPTIGGSLASEIIMAIYILANRKNGTLYVGVTDDLFRRGHEHRNGVYDGFTKKYGLEKLVYFERYGDMPSAIHRENRLKKYKREQKIRLIEAVNPDWRDLYTELFYHYNFGDGPIVCFANSGHVKYGL